MSDPGSPLERDAFTGIDTVGPDETTGQEAPVESAFVAPTFLPPGAAEVEESPGRRRWRRAQYAIVDGFRPLELDLVVPDRG